jgi:hypothetical protein
MAIRNDFAAGEVLAAADLNDTFASRAFLSVAVNAKTDNYTLALDDAGELITVNSASAKTVTIPTNGVVPFPNGTVVAVASLNTGEVSIAGASGVTIQSVKGTSPKLAGQYAGAQCYKIGTDTWLVIGGLA